MMVPHVLPYPVTNLVGLSGIHLSEFTHKNQHATGLVITDNTFIKLIVTMTS